MTRTPFEGRHLQDLSSGGMFALWCLRKRVLCLKQGTAPEDHLRHGFQLAGIPSALQDFEVLFDWLTETSTRPIHLGCSKCGRISRDEALLLSALAAFQRRDSASGQILLGCFMPRVACLHAAAAAARLVAAMARADLPVDLNAAATDRDADTSVIDARGAAGVQAPSSASVH